MNLLMLGVLAIAAATTAPDLSYFEESLRDLSAGQGQPPLLVVGHLCWGGYAPCRQMEVVAVARTGSELVARRRGKSQFDEEITGQSCPVLASAVKQLQSEVKRIKPSKPLPDGPSIQASGGDDWVVVAPDRVTFASYGSGSTPSFSYLPTSGRKRILIDDGRISEQAKAFLASVGGCFGPKAR